MSCYCEECFAGNNTECENTNCVDNWDTRDLETEGRRRRRVTTRSETAENQASLKDSIVTGSIVAIASADADYEYYLLKVRI